MGTLEGGFAGQPATNKKIFLTWEEVNEAIKELHKHLLGINYLVEAIVVPHKGGIIPGTMLAYRLKIDDIYIIKMRENDLVYPKDVTNLARKRILILDNIIETGENLAYLMKLMERVGVAQMMVASLLQKPSDKRILGPQYAVRTIDKEDWAIFPWEEMNY